MTEHVGSELAVRIPHGDTPPQLMFKDIRCVSSTKLTRRLLPCGRVGPLCAWLKNRAETLLGIWTATSKELRNDVIAEKKDGPPVSGTKYIYT